MVETDITITWETFDAILGWDQPFALSGDDIRQMVAKRFGAISAQPLISTMVGGKFTHKTYRCRFIDEATAVEAVLKHHEGQ